MPAKVAIVDAMWEMTLEPVTAPLGAAVTKSMGHDWQTDDLCVVIGSQKPRLGLGSMMLGSFVTEKRWTMTITDYRWGESIKLLME